MKRHAFLLLAATVVFAQAAPKVEITAEPRHHFVFENKQVRVFNVEVPPQSETLMHWHRHDYVYVTLGSTDLINHVEGKDPVKLTLPDADTRFLPATFAHAVRDLSEHSFRNVTVEFLEDEKLRKSPSKWDEERALNILEGGTQQILFVKDGVRASLFEVQPAGMVPMHHHAGPHMVIAVTDVKFRSQVEGKGSSEIELKSGDSRWVEGGFSHTLTNIGKQQAKWVTLEFP
jgi:quercetin dioxygenase-like cupin family protein